MTSAGAVLSECEEPYLNEQQDGTKAQRDSHEDAQDCPRSQNDEAYGSKEKWKRAIR